MFQSWSKQVEHHTEDTQNIYNKILQENFSNLQKRMPKQVQGPTELQIDKTRKETPQDMLKSKHSNTD